MSPQEHETLQLKMQVMSKDILLKILTGHCLYAQSFLESEQRLRRLSELEEALNKGRSEYSGIAFSDLSPVESDFRASLFQEAFESDVRKIESFIAPCKID